MSERMAGDHTPDDGFETVYYYTGSAEERMPLGTLLDWIDVASVRHDRAVDDGDDRAFERYRGHLKDARRALDRRREGLDGEPDEVIAMISLGHLGRAVDRNDLYLFLRMVPGVGRASLAEAGRTALSFTSPRDRLAALEETVLIGEARALGIQEAQRRRREWRAEVFHGLKQRLVDAMAPSEEGT